MKEFIKETIKELTEKSIVDLSVIPDIELYVDQVTTFIEDKLSAYKSKEDDKILTKTMINNYTKARLIEPPIKKRYSKENVEALIMIFHLKYVLSIENVRYLTDILENNAVEEMYRVFTEIQKREEQQMMETVDKIDFSEDRKEIFKAVCALAEGAVIRKRLAERLIEKYLLPTDNKE